MGKPKTLNPVDEFLGWPAKLAAAKQGDRKAVYAEYLESTVWRGRRIAALERAGNHCQICNSAEALQVHHRTYERVGDESPEDLTVLCRSCHERFHGIGEDSKPAKMRKGHKPCEICKTNLTTKGRCKPCRGLHRKAKRKAKGPQPSRSEVQVVSCPTCKAGKGQPCHLRKANHIARVYRYKQIKRGRTKTPRE